MVMEHRLGHFTTIIDRKVYALARAATQTYHQPGATKELFIPSQIHNHCLPLDEILLLHQNLWFCNGHLIMALQPVTRDRRPL